MKNNLIKITNKGVLPKIKRILSKKIKNNEILEYVFEFIKLMNIDQYVVTENKIVLKNTKNLENFIFEFSENDIDEFVSVKYTLENVHLLDLNIKTNKKQKNVTVDIISEDNKSRTCKIITQEYFKNKLYYKKSEEKIYNDNGELYLDTIKIIKINEKNVNIQETIQSLGQLPIERNFNNKIKAPILYSSKKRKIVNVETLEGRTLWETRSKVVKNINNARKKGNKKIKAKRNLK